MRSTTHLGALLVATLLTACGGPSVDSICDQLADCTGEDRDDCVQEGEALEEKAEEAGCSDTWDDFLSCLDDNFECVDGEPEGGDACEDILEECEG